MPRRLVWLVLAAVIVSVVATASLAPAPVEAAPGDRIVAFEARGTGFGHGRGMGQMGAIGRALAGQNVDQILGAYYGGTVYGTRTKSNLRGPDPRW